jgi:hypothetical protein
MAKSKSRSVKRKRANAGDTVEVTGRDKVRIVAEQMQRERKPGERMVLLCPYCDGISSEGETFCCELLMKAFEAILDASAQVHQLEVTAKAVERHLRN